MTVEKWQLHLQKVLVSLRKLKKAKDYFAIEKLEKGNKNETN
jgi:hypothetical protein